MDEAAAPAAPREVEPGRPIARSVDDEVETVLLIGHNPGIADLALALAGSGEKVPQLRGKYPTGALATLAFEGTWRDLAPGRTELTGYVTPKQLS